jgi:hypothetical protein
MMELNCELCGKYGEVTKISKQIGGSFHWKFVCPECEAAHEHELELTRENFRRQYGGE